MLQALQWGIVSMRLPEDTPVHIDRHRTRGAIATAVIAAGLCLAAIGASTPAQADYKRGIAAYTEGSYGLAYRELQPMASQGHPGAQLHLGLMYLGGKGVAHAPARGYRLLGCAAHAGGEIGERANRLRDQIGSALSAATLQAASASGRDCKAIAGSDEPRRSGAPAPRLNRDSLLAEAFYLPADLFLAVLFAVADTAGATGVAQAISNQVTQFGNGVLSIITLVFWAFGIRWYFRVLNSVKLLGVGSAKRVLSRRGTTRVGKTAPIAKTGLNQTS